MSFFHAYLLPHVNSFESSIEYTIIDNTSVFNVASQSHAHENQYQNRKNANIILIVYLIRGHYIFVVVVC